MRQSPTIDLTLKNGHPLKLKAKAIEEVVGTDNGCIVVTGNGQRHEVKESYGLVCLTVKRLMEERDAS